MNNTLLDGFDKNKQKEEKTKLNLSSADIKFIEDIAPKYGILEKERFVETGYGFITVYHMIQFNEDLRDFWLTGFAKMPNVKLVMDIETEDKSNIKKGVNNTIAKNRSKLNSPRNHTQTQDAIDNIEESSRLYKDLKDGREGTNSFTIKIIMFGSNPEELKIVMKRVDSQLDSFNITKTIALNQIGQNLNTFKFYNPTKQITTTTSLASSFPFYQQELVDPKGFYFGRTKSQGNVFLDMTRNDRNKRLAYDFIITGQKGYGKSFLLKTIILQEMLRGHQIVVIDPEGEYTNIIKTFQGTVISFGDEDEQIINPLEFRSYGKSSLSNNSKTTDYIGFNEHVSNIKTLIKLFNNDLNNDDLFTLESAILELYRAEKYQISDQTNTMNWKNDDFPLLEDLLLVIEQMESVEGLEIFEKQSLSRIYSTINSIVNLHSDYLNKHSTINIVNESLTSFDLKSLSNIADDGLRKAMMFTILNVFVLKQMNKNKVYNDNREKGSSRRLLRVIIDEAHLILNEDSVDVVKSIATSIKLFRKYSAGLGMANQSLEDYLLSNTNSPIYSYMKKIFEESVYKFIMKQDFSSMNDYRNKLGDNITETDLEAIRNFKKGESLLLLPSKKAVVNLVVDKQLQTLFSSENLGDDDE